MEMCQAALTYISCSSKVSWEQFISSICKRLFWALRTLCFSLLKFWEVFCCTIFRFPSCFGKFQLFLFESRFKFPISSYRQTDLNSSASKSWWTKMKRNTLLYTYTNTYGGVLLATCGKRLLREIQWSFVLSLNAFVLFGFVWV